MTISWSIGFYLEYDYTIECSYVLDEISFFFFSKAPHVTLLGIREKKKTKKT